MAIYKPQLGVELIIIPLALRIFVKKVGGAFDLDFVPVAANRPLLPMQTMFCRIICLTCGLLITILIYLK